MNKDPFEKYLKEEETDKINKKYIWDTAIGLQEVDGLRVSAYLKDTAFLNIEGELSINEVDRLVSTYYEEKKDRNLDNERVEEADKVAINITRLLLQKAFSFGINEYINIHYALFKDIYEHAGKLRTYNITKKEWILEEDTVIYANANNLRQSLEYDLDKEKNFSYKDLSVDEVIKHLARFIADLWQIHPFEEGNTRVSAVFLIKYLNSLGFKVSNELFLNNSWYFRNALVRANYTNIQKGVYETTKYLENFLKNLLLNEKHNLSNRDLHI